MCRVLKGEPKVGAGLTTSPRAATFVMWLLGPLALLVYWFNGPILIWLPSAMLGAYGSGALDGYRWAREQRWREWAAEHIDPEWANHVDSKWLECKLSQSNYYGEHKILHIAA